MKIDKVTITGADDMITYLDLLTLQEDFPFVEWGVLFSESRAGNKRYPSANHRKNHFIGGLNLSAHFCGWWAKQVLEEGNFNLISNLPDQYKRVQLNYNFANSHASWKLKELSNFASSEDNRRIIIQYNRSNQPHVDAWLSRDSVPSKIHFLYDASGGRGTEIKSIEPPIGGHYTGYAGGLSLENIDPVCCDIGRVTNDSSVWVDLETGARTNDQFDLKKTREILDKTQYHLKVTV
jgi:hypothetical protein